MKLQMLEELLEARRQNVPVAVLTALDSGRQWLYRPSTPADDITVPRAVLAGADSALRDDRSRVVDADGERFFIQTHNPPLRLYIVGAVHIAQTLAPMARLVGYDVTVIDPRRTFAAAERFPDVRIDHEWPDEALERVGLDARCGVVTLTHDPKLDDAALCIALASRVFYIGCLGSTRTHRGRLSRLEKAGFEPAVLARIHGPVGLDIAARSPAEIAVAILGEMTQALRAGGCDEVR